MYAGARALSAYTGSVRAGSGVARRRRRWWPWEEVLLALREADPAALDDQDPASRALLERAFPLLESQAEVRLDDLDPSALFRVYEAVRRVLLAAARKRPIAVAIDDLHRADEASLHLLEWIVARSANAGILLLAAYRQHAVREDGARRAARERPPHCSRSRPPEANAAVRHHVADLRRHGSHTSADRLPRNPPRAASDPHGRGATTRRPFR